MKWAAEIHSAVYQTIKAAVVLALYSMLAPSLLCHRQYVTPCDEPMAFAEESHTHRRSPAPKATSTVSAEADADADDTPIGADYQASIPTWRPRPAQPTPSEAKLLPAAPLYTPTAPVASKRGTTGDSAAANALFKAKYQAGQNGTARCRLLASAVQAQDQKMGSDKVKVRAAGNNPSNNLGRFYCIAARGLQHPWHAMQPLSAHAIAA